MKITELKQGVIAFILADINLSLSRLGVSENVEVTDINDAYMVLGTQPIKQMPMIFKKVSIDGSLCFIVDDSYRQQEGDILINVSLGFRTVTFDDGHNGTTIGNVVYRMSPMPENVEDSEIKYYIRKMKAISI